MSSNPPNPKKAVEHGLDCYCGVCLIRWPKEHTPLKRPGRPRNKQVTVAPEQLDSLTIKAQGFIKDTDALVAWLNERRMVAIVALGEALTDPKLFLEVTDDLLDAMKDMAPEKKKKR